MMRLHARLLAAGVALCAAASGWSEEFAWKESGAGLAMTLVQRPGPVVFMAVRVELEFIGKEFDLTTTLANNTIVGIEMLSSQVNSLPKELGTPVAAVNGDFFKLGGEARGDPRGLQIWRGELVSTPSGPATFWVDAHRKFHGEQVTSKLTVSWPNGGTNLAGLNEEHGTYSMVLFTPRMGNLSENLGRSSNRGFSSPRRGGPPGGRGGPIRLPGGHEWTLEYSGAGPWLPLRVGQTYRAIARESSDGFVTVPENKMLLSLGPDALADQPDLTNGTPVTITVATDPDLSGVQTAIGSGPMLVRGGKLHEVTSYMSEQLHPRSAFGWNDKFLHLVVADGRQPEYSVGIRLSEMAEFMIELGCQEAIDMDGGQSTGLILNGALINHPSMGREREIANALVVVRKSAVPVKKVEP